VKLGGKKKIKEPRKKGGVYDREKSEKLWFNRHQDRTRLWQSSGEGIAKVGKGELREGEWTLGNEGGKKDILKDHKNRSIVVD